MPTDWRGPAIVRYAYRRWYDRQGRRWIAQATHHDVRAEGGTWSEAEKNLREKMDAHLAERGPR